MPPHLIELTEYRPRLLPRDALSTTLGERLWRDYDANGRKIRVEFPSPATGHCWRLTNLGWAGTIPLTAAIHLSLRPKVHLANLFRMWQYAYRLQRFYLFDELFSCRSLAESYERLAHILAQRILARGRQGYHRAYLDRHERLPYLRGRLDLAGSFGSDQAATAVPNLLCHYEEQTADIPDNQILAWTMRQIARSGLCSERSLPAIRRAYRTLPVTLRPFSAADCDGRRYHRLNQDYAPLHALCRFFLEHTGPHHEHSGAEHAMISFLIDMAHLYEQFVAEWLQSHLPTSWQLTIQEPVSLGAGNALNYSIDLVLDNNDGRRLVLDTKYKTPARAANADVNQIIAYARLKRCREAILVYPQPLARPLDVWLDDLHIRSLAFDLSGDLEGNGRAFLQQLSII